MAILTWDEEYSVKVKVFDAEHKTLINLINKLHDAMMEGKTKEVLEKTISDLTNYTIVHFSSEEKYFDQMGYPEKEIHKKEHDGFISTVTEFKSKFEGGNTIVSMEILSFLKNWLITHMKVTDKKYSMFFNERGLK